MHLKFPMMARMAATALFVLLVSPLYASGPFLPDDNPTVLAPEFGAAACTVDKARELMITDLSVVEDCRRTTWGPCPIGSTGTQGVWTFGHLMTGIFGTTNAATLSNEVLKWLKHWQADQIINSDLNPARTKMQQLVTDPWLQASGGYQLDMRLAPFRLLAIVARLDLRQSGGGGGGYGGGGGGFSGGEGRFVFGVLDSAGNQTPFTVIIEYGLPSRGCEGNIAWGNAFHGLGSIPFGPTYNWELEKITKGFTSIGAGGDDAPNGSALNQLRTNDIELTFNAPPPVQPNWPLWELREFRLGKSTSLPFPLVQTTVALTPDFDHNFQQITADFINTNEPAILAGTHSVPLTFMGTPFLGSWSPTPFGALWDGPPPACSTINNPQARHLFSLNTCSGCHAGETGTTFLHVAPRNLGTPSALSGFLTGTTVTDPCGLTHSFDDLTRRAKDLCNLIAGRCAMSAAADQGRMVRSH